MGININLPKITATNPTEQIRQMQSYLFQMTEQLNWALSTIETSVNNVASSAVEFEQKEEISEKEAEDTFNSIKALIIKSADIVHAYEETIMEDFNGRYFADSDFGTYLEETSRSIEENSKGVNEVYTNVQTITDKVGNLEEDTRTTNAYIRRGYLDTDDNGNAIYGVEVGETNEDGAFLKCARFQADRLTFFDANEKPVAYIGSGDRDKDDFNCLYITGKAVFQSDAIFGKYKADTSDGLAFTWVE